MNYFHIEKNGIERTVYFFNKKVLTYKKHIKIDKRFYSCCDIKNIEELLINNNRFDHPVGIVISKFARIGKNNRIYQNVTIGSKTLGGSKRSEYPTIGNDNILCANSVILGKIKIGDHCIIAANTVVVVDVPSYTMVCGNGKLQKMIKITKGYYYE